ncbi:MAG: InlB B-repeat-containing protein, partial [Oscillospiraceae bacterium]|nr:InlB B-repeat-containing protein [Oscillospiraceae bacterium]
MKKKRKLISLLLALVLVVSLVPAMGGTAGAANSVTGTWYCTDGTSYIKSVLVNGAPLTSSTVLEAGSTATITVEAAEFYRATSFDFLETGLSDSYTLSGTGSTTTGTFTVPDKDFTLRLSVESEGYVVWYVDGMTPLQSFCYEYGTSVTVKGPEELSPALQKTGYTFVGWGERQTGTAVDYQPGDTLQAENKYARNEKTLFARWKENGAYTIVVENGKADKIAAKAGETVTITADPRENFTFDHWEVVSGDVTLKDRNSAETTFVMGDQDVSLRAVNKYTGPMLTDFYVYITPP